VPVALTVEQVRELDLPSTPLKETERRADRWREAFGVEQTEIDALATLRPRAFREIVTNAIEPFFDSSLRARVAEAETEWREAAQIAVDRQVDREALAFLSSEAASRLADLEDSIDAINQRLRMTAADILELPAVIVPEPEIDEDSTRLASLASSRRAWAEVTQALIAHKAYGGAE
jgi:hypothetical protein